MRPLLIAAALALAAASPAAAGTRSAPDPPDALAPAPAGAAAAAPPARPEPAAPSPVEHVIWFAAGAVAGGVAVSALAGGRASRRPPAPRPPDADLRRLLGGS